MTDLQWRVAFASATGTSHVATGAGCQDRVTQRVVMTSEGANLVAVICDGAGSARFAEVGAELVSTTFLACVERDLSNGLSVSEIDEALARKWIAETISAVREEADKRGRPVHDYACTMLACVVGEAAAAFVQIGDGAIVVCEAPLDGWAYVFWPQHGEFVNTTNFITSENAVEVVMFDAVNRRLEEIAMFSDGIENLVLHRASMTVHDPFFDGMMVPVRGSKVTGTDEQLSNQLRDYLMSPIVCERTDDDKTLLLATRRPRDDLDAEHLVVY